MATTIKYKNFIKTTSLHAQHSKQIEQEIQKSYAAEKTEALKNLLSSAILIQSDAKKDEASIKTFNTLDKIPWIPISTKAVIKAPFGEKRTDIKGRPYTHTGIDLAASGLPIYAVASGTVVNAGNGALGSGYGIAVRIEHNSPNLPNSSKSGKISTVYGHLAKVFVKEGQKVARGTQIGIEGSTGRSTGIHLHFEVEIDGIKTDPKPHISNSYK